MFRTMRKLRMKKESGFTLIELLVVVAIIGILAAIALPKLFSAICQAKVGQADGVVGSINGALSMYFADAKGIYPNVGTSLISVGSTAMGKFHPTFMAVPPSPWQQATSTGSASEYTYKGSTTQYTLCIEMAEGLGCDGTATNGDEYRYYSSASGQVGSTSSPTCS